MSTKLETFDIVTYRQGARGLERYTLTVDENAMVVGEATAPVDTFSKTEHYAAFMNTISHRGSAVLSKGVMAERAEKFSKLREERVDAQGRRVVSPTPVAVKLLQLLTSQEPTCVSDRCKEIRAMFEADQLAAGGSDCPNCKRGQLLVKYQQMLLAENIKE